MSIENPLTNVPLSEDVSEPEPNAETKIRPSNKLGGLINKVKKTAALAGAVGVGYFGSLGNAEARDVSVPENSTGPKFEHVTDQSAGKPIEAPGMFEVLFRENNTTWGVEYVSKSKDGRNFLAQRYVKVDDLTGTVNIVGEYDNVIEASKGLAKTAGVPEQIIKHAQYDAGAIETERRFQASGFTESTGDAGGKTHVEERRSEEYGVQATNTVEVDDNNKVVRIIGSKF
jgi:hypothetical protein